MLAGLHAEYKVFFCQAQTTELDYNFDGHQSQGYWGNHKRQEAIPEQICIEASQ